MGVDDVLFGDVVLEFDVEARACGAVGEGVAVPLADFDGAFLVRLIFGLLEFDEVMCQF